MRQKIRRTLVLISLLLFPITLNYFSPYVSIDGAVIGVVSGSLLLFITLFITSAFFGRAWCGWICPMAGLSEMTIGINSKKVNVKRLRISRYSVFTVWGSILIAFFVMAGGIKGIDPFHLTENIISVDEPVKYVIYYAVLGIFVLLSLTLGKRGGCHSICWMSPFMTAGYNLGKIFRLPQLRVKADENKCVNCGICDKKCPMSINVSSYVPKKSIESSDCIMCGECVDCCNKSALQFGVRAYKE